MTQGSARITNAHYHSDPAVSASMLKVITTHGPRAYWNSFLNPEKPERKESAAMFLGTLTHCAVLEPEELDKRFKVVSSRTTKKGKEEAAEAAKAGLIATTKSDMELALKMKDAVFKDKEAKSLLSHGTAEKSFWRNDDSTGLVMKARSDWENVTTLVDLKTSRSGANPIDFAKTVTSFKYHLQAAHYLNVTGYDRFIFLVVQSEWPFDIGIYELDDDAMQEGRRLCRKGLDKIAECELAGEWPGWADRGVQKLSLPRWAFPTPTNK